MEIFLCWSEDRSKAFANELRDWLTDVHPGLRPWISDRDIEKGERWLEALMGVQPGAVIVCLTRENYSSQWIWYEIGHFSGRFPEILICPLLLEGDDSLLTRGPLHGRQATIAKNKEKFFELLLTLNKRCTERLPRPDLGYRFEHEWKRLFGTIDRLWPTDQRPDDTAQVAIPQNNKEAKHNSLGERRSARDYPRIEEALSPEETSILIWVSQYMDAPDLSRFDKLTTEEISAALKPAWTLRLPTHYEMLSANWETWFQIYIKGFSVEWMIEASSRSAATMRQLIDRRFFEYRSGKFDRRRIDDLELTRSGRDVLNQVMETHFPDRR